MLDEKALALALDHLKLGDVIIVNGVKYAAEKRPRESALCDECSIYEEYKMGCASQAPVCVLCIFLTWQERKRPYKLRIKKVEI